MEIIGTIGIPLALVMIVVALALSIVFPVLDVIKHFDQAKKSLLGVGAMLAIFLIGYVTASSDLPEYAIKANVTSSQFKLISASLTTFLITLLLTIVVVVYDIVKGFVNK